MEMLPAPVSPVLHANNHMLDGTSSSIILPRHQDGYYSSPSPPNTDQRDQNPNNVDQSNDPNKKTRKFVCQYCGRKFLRAEHLRRHETTHTGDKPFHCPYCKEAFSRSDILKRHIAKCRAAGGSDHILLEPDTLNAPSRRACDRCARLKVRCDFVEPCSRCSRQQMDCTYHRLSSNKNNGSGDERRSTQVSLNGNGTAPQRQSQTKDSSLTGLRNTTRAFSGFPGPLSLTQNQTGPSPPRMLPPALTSPSIGMYNLQQSSSPDHPNHIAPPNQTVRDQNNSGSGLSPFNTFPTLSTSGPSLMDLSHAAANHQPVFSQNLDLSNTSDTEVMFASSDPSDLIFNNQFSAEDTFFSWKPFEYNMHNDACLDFHFDPDLDFDIGFSPKDPQLNHTLYVPPTVNISHEPVEEFEKEEIPDEGLVATFDPGTGDVGEEPAVHCTVPSRAGQSYPDVGDYLQLIQVDPLQARCEALAIAVFGSLENLQQQDTWIVEFFTANNIKLMLFLWARRWAQHVPIIHLPTFSILTAPDALLFILCVIGKAYTRPGIDTERLQWCIDVFSKLSSMARVNGELDMVNLEAVYILVVLCTWHGNRQQRDMAKKLYRKVVDMARKYGYCQVPPKEKTDGSDEAEWKSWIEQETRIRFMMNVYLMDGGYVVFFNTRPVLQYQEVQLPFPCDGALWVAPTAATWKREIQKPRERDWLPQTLHALIHASLQLEDDHTDLYGKFFLIHGLINYIWDRQYELDCQTDPFPGDVINFRTSTTRALDNWRQLWDAMLSRLEIDRSQWARLGFFRNSLEYWYAAKLFLAQPRRSGWGQPYDDDNNLFRVKRLLRTTRVWVVRGEKKSGLSERDLRVPNFLETLKVVVPELASVRIEEAPSPRPTWKNSGVKQEKKI